MANEPPRLQEISGPQIQITGIPVVYCNGFVNTLGASDISMILLLDAVPAVKIHMSFTTAKTMAKLLGELVTKLEGVTSNQIMLTSEVEAGLKKSTDGQTIKW